MIKKTKEKDSAVKLRKQGFSYSEILKKIPVAKSTLSLWLRSVGLANKQKQKITQKRLNALKRGVLVLKNRRISKTRTIKNNAKAEVSKLINNRYWLAGLVLYWAEGSKEKPWGKGQIITLTNTDSDMITIFRRWLRFFFNVEESNFVYELYIHKDTNTDKAISYWCDILKIDKTRLRVYFKKVVEKKRLDTNRDYFGTFRLKVYKSTDLNRKIAGWTEGMVEYLKKDIVNYSRIV